ncbi:chaperone DnaJ-domain superfamily protein [Klebsormidium nitens]|uniref:Chaperone DnaJ-domain superfamily protein n=1 Tax=Klebsormidium nitens TaxID=105231 RepID=A0A1Y1I3Q2_KLENI|nr:chaperone DnaJ-domain superfamily protein [Klebsormidium nitens]|eukprot:GAQ84039.1 chaperone DnaJ-domain superfamily protein [Klebsormidium nitens]
MSCRGPSETGLPPHKPKCLYEVLGLSKNASVHDIRVAYKTLAKKWHPDRCQAKERVELAKQKFQRISEAYAVLVDPKKREKYDRGELDHNKEPIDVEEFLNELRTLMLMHGKTFPEGIKASTIHNIPGTNVPDFNEIRTKLMADPVLQAQHRRELELEAQQGLQGNGCGFMPVANAGGAMQSLGGQEDVEMEAVPAGGGAVDHWDAFMEDSVEVLGKNWFRCTLCTGPRVPVVVYPCRKMMRTHFEQEHLCDFLSFVAEVFPEEGGTDPCEEFKKMLDGMNVSENDWKVCQMIDQSARQAPPPHRPNGYTHGTHGPGRMQASPQVPYSLSFTDLAGIDASPPVPLMQRTFTMQRSMPNPPTESLCPDWMGQVLQQAGGLGQWDSATSSSSSPSSSFYPSPGAQDVGFGGGFAGFTMGGEFGGFPNGGAAASGGNAGGRPPLSGGAAVKGGKSSGSSCILSRKWGKR